MSVYEALTRADFKQFKYHGKRYPHDNRYIYVKANAVTFMINRVGNEQPLTYPLRDLRVRVHGDIIYILDRRGKTIITICKSS